MTVSENSLESMSNSDPIDVILKYVSKDDLMTTMVTLEFFSQYYEVNVEHFSNFYICFKNTKNYLCKFYKKYMDQF